MSVTFPKVVYYCVRQKISLLGTNCSVYANVDTGGKASLLQAVDDIVPEHIRTDKQNFITIYLTVQFVIFNL